MVDLDSRLEKLSFLNGDQVREIAKSFGTPVFVYSQRLLEKQADKALNFPKNPSMATSPILG